MSRITKVLACSFSITILFLSIFSSDVRSEQERARIYLMTEPGEGIAANAPQGSYRLTCAYAKLNLNTLTGKCIDIKEQWIDAWLNIYGCVDDIANMDGVLSCSKGGVPPKGSYRKTCRLIEVNTVAGVPLTAQCQAGDGHWLRTNHAGSCPEGKDLANLNGQLTCNP